MAKINRTNIQGMGPMYDLSRVEDMSELEDILKIAESPTLDTTIVSEFEKIMGLKNIPPQAGHLEPPPQKDVSIHTLTGPQLRGFLRKTILNFHFCTQALDNQDSINDSPIKEELSNIERMINFIDNVLRFQDEILGKMATEEKA